MYMYDVAHSLFGDLQNQTAIFNLYGLTEVSSWASCSLLPHTAEPVTLGNPLLGTKVEVRSEDGSLIQHGEGIIWAGIFDYVDICVTRILGPRKELEYWFVSVLNCVSLNVLLWFYL